MIDLLTGQELHQIAERHSPTCVSIYLPTHRAGPEVQQDPIRLKNLVAIASSELAALGLRRDEVDDLMAPASALVPDADFWSHGERGLAVLISPEDTRIFHLGEAPEEVAVVADRFHVKPLLRSVSAGEVFWILAISQNRIRLLQGGPTAASEVALGEIPDSLASALWFEDRERQIQSHGSARVGAGRVSATFHGHGLGKDTRHADLAQFLRVVDDGVCHVVEDGSEPIVLAGVERDLTAYREVSRSRALVEEAVTGNCDHLSPDDLHARAWPLVKGRFESDRIRVEEAIRAESSPVTDDLVEIHTAAEQGRVEAVIVALDIQLWGRTPNGDRSIVLHETRESGDRDLLDALAIETMEHGGAVHAVPGPQVPRDAPAVALLRW